MVDEKAYAGTMAEEFGKMRAEEERDALAMNLVADMHTIPPVAPWIGRPSSDSVHQYKGFRPLSDQILVRPLAADDQMSADSRLFMPANADRGRLQNRHGIVVALGCGDSVVPATSICNAGNEKRWKLPKSQTGRTEFSVQVGDHVIFAARTWAEITLDSETLVVLHEDQHILAVIDPETVLFSEDITSKWKG